MQSVPIVDICSTCSQQQVIVQELMNGGTAARSRLQPGDVITHIDAEPVGPTPSMPELIRRIKGAPGTTVPVSCSSYVFLIPVQRSCLEGGLDGLSTHAG